MQTQTLEEILHALLALTVTAAAVFIKNPNSQAHAATMVTVGTNVLLPLADQLVEDTFAAQAQQNAAAQLGITAASNAAPKIGAVSPALVAVAQPVF